MKFTTIRAHALALPLAAAVLLAGCASGSAPRYYSLADAEAAPTAPAGAAASAIELAPVAMPERFARPQMVVRRSASGVEVDILEQHRWSSSFDDELRDALGSGIAQRLGAVDASRSVRPRGQSLLRIAVQLRQLDAIEGHRVDAGFSWTLRRSEEGASLGCQLFVSEPAAGGIDALALATRRAIGRLADAIARSARAQQAGEANPCGG